MAIRPTHSNLPLEAMTNCDLDEAQLEAEAEVIAALLAEMGVAEVLFECQEGRARLPVFRMVTALREGLPQQAWDPWEGTLITIDRTFVVPGRDLEFEFCHHDQVHVRTTDPEMLERFWSRWLSLGLAFGRRNGEEWDWETSETP